MGRQRAKQVTFIKYAFGGSKDYSGNDLVKGARASCCIIAYAEL